MVVHHLKIKSFFLFWYGAGVYCAIDEVVLFLYFSLSVSAVALVGLNVLKSDYFSGPT